MPNSQATSEMSNDSWQEIVSTDYGRLSIEVVNCASCGEVVAKETASDFTVGDTEGWACRFCSDDPAGFPEGDEDDDSSGLGEQTLAFIGLVALSIGLLPTASLFVLPFGITLFTFWQGVSMTIVGLAFTSYIVWCLKQIQINNE